MKIQEEVKGFTEIRTSYICYIDKNSNTKTGAKRKSFKLDQRNLERKCHHFRKKYFLIPVAPKPMFSHKTLYSREILSRHENK